MYISRNPNSDRNVRNLSSEIMYIFREELDIAKQKAYDEGIIYGRSLASENLRSFREEYERKIEIMGNQIKKLESENSRQSI